MAQLKDLIVNGASRLIGDAFANKLQITTLADSANSIGTNGQVLKSDGSKIVWGSDSNSDTNVSQTITTTNSDYRLLFSATADDTTRTEGARKDTDLRWNPSTNTLELSAVNSNAKLRANKGTLTITAAESTLYLNRPTSSSIVFQHNGNNKVWIDTNDAFRTTDHNSLDIGTSTIGWKQIFISSQDGAMNNGLQFTNGTDITGRVGSNSTGKIGIYGSTDVIIRPSLTSSGVGIVLNGTSIVPGANNNHTLGSSSLKWNNIYATTFTGDLTGNATTATTATKLSTNAGSQLNPVYFSGGVPVASTGNSIPFITGTGTTAGTWLGNLTGLTAYYDGLLILYKSPVAGASTTTLNLNNLGAKTIYVNNTTKLTTHFPANQPILLTYSTSQNSGCWMCLDDYWTNSDTYTSAYCGTAAGTVAKAATCTYWTATPKSYIHINFRYANTAANPTLNIASTGAKPIYVNGVRATGSVLPAGSYIAYYDGTNYQFRTDGFLPGEGSKQLKFLNTTVPTTAWVNDATYSQYPKKADITCTGVTGDMYGDIIFNVTEAVSGNFAPIAATGDNKVTIWAQDTPTTDIVIPTIVVF